MKIVTTAEMLEIEKKCGFDNFVLMKEAGKSFVKELLHHELLEKEIDFLVICGKGKNGGDGFIIAEDLQSRGYRVKLLSIFPQDQLCNETAFFAKKFIDLHIFYGFCLPETSEKTIIIDAIFGIGFNKNLDSIFCKLFNQINSANYKKIISVDIPSGLSSDSGIVQSLAILADLTITIGFPKIGLFFNDGLEFCGDLLCAKIAQFSQDNENSFKAIFSAQDFLQIRRKKNSHKKTFGTVAIIGGSKNYQGAAILATKSALRSGCGFVTLATDENLDISRAPLATILQFLKPENEMKILENLSRENTVCVFGMGVGRQENQQKRLLKILESANTLILDADGLFHLTQITDFSQFAQLAILTPHPGEMSTLINRFCPQILVKNRFEQATFLAKKLNCIIVLKGKFSLIATPNEKASIITSGNSSLSTAGSGDVLSGIIAAFVAYARTNLLEVSSAINAAVFVHGKLGEIAKSRFSLIADDLPDLLKEILP